MGVYCLYNGLTWFNPSESRAQNLALPTSSRIRLDRLSRLVVCVLLTYQKKSHLKPSQVSLKNQQSGQSVSNNLDIPTPNVAFYGTITPRRIFEMSADFHEPKTCKLGVSWRFIGWVLGQCCRNRGFRIEMGGSTVSHNPFHLQLSPNNAGAWPSK